MTTTADSTSTSSSLTDATLSGREAFLASIPALFRVSVTRKEQCDDVRKLVDAVQVELAAFLFLAPAWDLLEERVLQYAVSLPVIPVKLREELRVAVVPVAQRSAEPLTEDERQVWRFVALNNRIRHLKAPQRREMRMQMSNMFVGSTVELQQAFAELGSDSEKAVICVLFRCLTLQLQRSLIYLTTVTGRMERATMDHRLPEEASSDLAFLVGDALSGVLASGWTRLSLASVLKQNTVQPDSPIQLSKKGWKFFSDASVHCRRTDTLLEHSGEIAVVV